MPAIPDLATCKKVGFIVPSSNTAVEPITNAIFQSLNSNIICLFTRIQVKTVGADANSTSQFSMEAMVGAARLLADAEVDAIVWNGTSGMWVGTGLEADKETARAMQDATGIPCSTTTIATIEALERLDAKSIAIAVPYTEALTAKLVEFYSGCGYHVAAAERLNSTPSSNLEIAKSSAESIARVIKRCMLSSSDAVVVACTNWPASGSVEGLEREHEIPIIDSIAVTTWWALCMIGYEGRISGWGTLFSEML